MLKWILAGRKKEEGQIQHGQVGYKKQCLNGIYIYEIGKISEAGNSIIEGIRCYKSGN